MATYSRKRKYDPTFEPHSPSPPTISPPRPSQPSIPAPHRTALQPRTDNALLRSTSTSKDTKPTTSPPPPNSTKPSKSTTTTTLKSTIPTRLTQLTIDLGGSPYRLCPHPLCRMQYIPSHAQDAQLHKKHHASVVGAGLDGGIEVPHYLLNKASSVRRVRTGLRQPRAPTGDAQRSKKSDGRPNPSRSQTQLWTQPKAKRKTNNDLADAYDSILIIGRGSSSAARRFAMQVLERAEMELGAVRTGQDEVWGRVRAPVLVDDYGGGKRGAVELGPRKEKRREGADSLPSPPTSSLPPSTPAAKSSTSATKTTPQELSTVRTSKRRTQQPTTLEPKHAIHLYIHQTTCVGLLLAERIYSARAVISPSAVPSRPHDATPTTLSTTTSITTGAGGSSSSSSSANPTPLPELKLSKTTHHAHTGISRIWVPPAHRGCGVGSALLDTVLSHPLTRTGQDVLGAKGTDALGVSSKGKEGLAFSAPTEMGRRLAEWWTGGVWSVYGEGDGFGV